MTAAEPGAGPRLRRRLWLMVGGIAVLAGLLLWIFVPRFGKDPREIQSPLIGDSVPALRLEYLDGTGAVSFDDLRGQVVVVNFFASWCVPNCRNEHPLLLAAQASYRDEGVQFLGIVYQDSAAAAAAFLDDLGWGDGYLYVVDPESRAAVEFGVWGVPETFFVDREGRIVGKITGPVTEVSLAEALDSILTGATG